MMKDTRVRTAIVLAALTSIPGAAIGGAAQFNQPKDVQELISIEKTVAELTDADAVIKYVDTNAIFADLLSPGWHEGRDNIYKVELKPQYATVKEIHARTGDMNVATDGRFACVAFQLHLDGTMQSGSALSTTFRELDAFKKVAGHWQWIQQQVSYPVDAKTGMSVTDGALPTLGPMKWSANPLPDPAEEPGQARQEIAAWLNRLVAITDVNDLATYFGPNQELLMYDPFIPSEFHGVQALRDRYGPMLSSMRSIHAELPKVAVDSDGLLGAVISRQDLTIQLKDGSTRNMSIRQSDCLRRVDGKWHAIFEMVSVPMDPKTGKAVMTSSGLLP